MKYIAIAGLAVLGIMAAGRPASAQSGLIDFDSALVSIASPGSQIETAGIETVEGVETPDGVEGPEGVEGPAGVEGPETPGDTGPNIDHQFDGEETGQH